MRAREARGRRLRRVLKLAAFLVVAVVAAGTVYFAIPQANLPEAAAALEATDAVDFRDVAGDLEFRPKTPTPPTTGLVIYPGGKVDPRAYAPTGAAIAGAGFLVVVVPMPLHLAVLDIDAATRVIERHPEIRTWAVGGHSLGGSMAAEYAKRQAHAVDGLVLWASYSATDLSQQGQSALLVYGSLDGGAARMGSLDSTSKLPFDRTIVVIEGGNHEQMGWYTGQANDPPATITRVAQQAQVVQATVDFLERLGR